MMLVLCVLSFFGHAVLAQPYYIPNIPKVTVMTSRVKTPVDIFFPGGKNSSLYPLLVLVPKPGLEPIRYTQFATHLSMRGFTVAVSAPPLERQANYLTRVHESLLEEGEIKTSTLYQALSQDRFGVITDGLDASKVLDPKDPCMGIVKAAFIVAGNRLGENDFSSLRHLRVAYLQGSTSFDKVSWNPDHFLENAPSYDPEGQNTEITHKKRQQRRTLLDVAALYFHAALENDYQAEKALALIERDQVEALGFSWEPLKCEDFLPEPKWSGKDCHMPRIMDLTSLARVYGHNTIDSFDSLDEFNP